MRPLSTVLEEALRSLAERLSHHLGRHAWVLVEELRQAGWSAESRVMDELRNGYPPTAPGWLHPPAPSIDSFPARLRGAREARQMTQEALAQALGYSGRSMICHYEAGTAKPSLEVVARMAEVLGVDAVWLSGLGG